MWHDTSTEKIILSNRTFFEDVTGLLEEGRSVTLTAKGDSMIPFIWGDMDKVMLQRTDRFSTGDIVLALPESGVYVLHRIIRIDGNTVLLMGDGNYIQTEQCTLSDIAGKVTHIIHKDRRIACDAPIQRIKARLWKHLRPLRRILLFAIRLWYRPIMDSRQERIGRCG